MNRIKQGPGPEAPIRGASIAEKPGAGIPSIPDHQLVRLIASGAYGEVWLGLSAVGTPRAIKIVRRDRHTTTESFEREFKGLQKFEPVSRSHEGLVDILTLGLLPDKTGFYYVMELADGISGSLVVVPTSAHAEAVQRIGPTPEQGRAELAAYAPRTLRAELKMRGALSAAEVIELGLKLTAALAHLHGNGLVHRDIKPSNILFIHGDPKLADAGLVAEVDDARSLVGTAGYIAPEGPGAPQADLYGLGKVLYEAAFGKDRQEFPELPVDVASRRDHTRLLELNEIIAKACAHDPKQRYASAEAMLTELRLLESGKSVKTRHTRQQIWNVCKKAGLAVALVALVLTIASRFMRRGAEEYDQSSDPEVQKLVEQGFVEWREGTPQRIRYAAEQFQKALQKEPNFVPALYGLGTCYLDDLTKVREITENLKRIAPHSAETWGNVAFLEWHEGRFRQGLADIKKATQMRPACKEGHAWAHGGYGFFLQHMGNAEGAWEQYRLAEKITGIDPIILDHFGHTYFMRSNWVEALKYHQAAINFMPNHPNGYHWKARTLEEMGRFTEAIEADEEHDRRAEEDPAEMKRFYDGLLSALEQGGPKGYWSKRLAEGLKRPSPDFYQIATFYVRLGDKDQAYDYLERAFKQTPFAGGLMVDPCWDRSDERFKAFARKVGLMR